jgi:uncharacterized membrane protein
MNGHTRDVTELPPATAYHRWLGWHAIALRRAAIAAAVGVAVGLMLVGFVSWELAIIGGWDAAAVVFLGTVWPMITRADASATERLATREDETRASTTVLITAASAASLLGVGFTLGLAGHSSGGGRAALITVAVVTVVVSWVVVNTVYTLRYGHLHYGSGASGFAVEEAPGQANPSYRDFAYIAFTIGMTYQVSDTAVRDTRTRRTVLTHAIVSYLFGVFIVGGAVNLIAGLIR